MSTPDARAFDEQLFWDMIESAWRRTPDGHARRRELAAGESQDPNAALAPFLTELDRVLGHLTADGLRTFGRELERALFALDREELARRIGLGDDGFGDARATIVLLGERHCRAVLADAARATVGLAVEPASYAFSRQWEKRFGESAPSFGTPTCTGSNPDGWPRVRERQAREARVGAAVAHLARELRLGAGEPRLAPGGFLHVTVPKLAPAELAIALGRLAALARGKA
ncbi:MAG: hypothetical protein ACLQVI_02555 [Polyangiaceae bacterium]